MNTARHPSRLPTSRPRSGPPGSMARRCQPPTAPPSTPGSPPIRRTARGSSYCQFSADLEKQLPLLAGIRTTAESQTVAKNRTLASLVVPPLWPGALLAIAVLRVVLGRPATEPISEPRHPRRATPDRHPRTHARRAQRPDRPRRGAGRRRAACASPREASSTSARIPPALLRRDPGRVGPCDRHAVQRPHRLQFPLEVTVLEVPCKCDPWTPRGRWRAATSSGTRRVP